MVKRGERAVPTSEELIGSICGQLHLHDGSGLLMDLEGTNVSAFDGLVGELGPAEAFAQLAGACWYDDAQLVASVAGAASLAHEHAGVRHVGIYYRALGTGGAERITLDTARLWRGMGLEVTLLCDEGHAESLDLAGEGIAVAELPNCLSPDPATQRRRPAALYEALSSRGIEALVYCQWLSPTLGWDLLAAHAAGASFIVFTHGTTRVLTGYQNPPDLRFPAMYRHADGVVCLSSEDQRFWSSFNGAVHRTVNKCDESFFAQPTAPLRGHRMAWVGRVSQDKAPLEMLDVLAHVRREVPDATLALMGPFGDCPLEQYRARAQELGVWDAIEVLGDVAHDELPGQLATADLVVFTSHMEGYPVALAEAKAAGLPCAMYDLAHLTLLEGGRGVLTAPIGDTSALGHQAARLLADKDFAQAMGADARAHARDLQDFDLAAFWRTVLATPSGAAIGPLQNGAGVACALFEAGQAQLAVRRACDDLRSQLDQERRAREELEGVLADVTGSVSFKAGRAITAPLRGLRDALGHAKKD